MTPKKYKNRVAKSVIDRDIIKAHIETFNPCVHHYRRLHAPLRRYLPSDITVKFMHDDFVEKNPDFKCSKETYRRVVKEMNISFAHLGHEECESCEEFNLHDSNHKDPQENPECPTCNFWYSHILKT